MTTRKHMLALAACAFLPAAAFGQSEPAQQRPETFEALLRCRAITEEAARLRCFDEATAALQAAAARTYVVVDRAPGPREPAAMSPHLPRLKVLAAAPTRG